MNLLYSLKESQKRILNITDNQIQYCIPFDIDEKGILLNNAFAVVTDSWLYIIVDDEIKFSISINDIEKIKCESMVHSGLLTVKRGDVDYIACRFTMAYITQFSYLAEGVQRLKEGFKERVVSREPEKFCPICHRALPKTKYCVRCAAKGRFLKRIGNMAKPFKFGFIALTILAILSTGLVLGTRFVERFFIDNHLIPMSGEVIDIVKFFVAILLMNGFNMVISIMINKKSASLGTKISKNLRAQIYTKLQKSSLEFILERNPGELMNRIHRDTQAIKRFFEIGFSRMFSTLLSMVGAITIMTIMDWKITLVAMIMVPIVLMISASFRKKMKRIFSAQWRFEDRANNQVQDAISGIRVIKSFGKEKEQTRKFLEVNTQLAQKQSANEKFWSTFHPSLSLLLGFTTLIFLLLGGINVLNGNFSIGQLSQFMAYAAILIGPLTWMSMLPRLFYHTITSIERIYDVLEDERVLEDYVDAIDKKIDGKVRFENVKFGYKTYEKVLDDVSFEVKKGEMIGIVGYSGAGKSTLINLLIRLYDPNYGDIFVDDFKLKELNSKDYHSQIGVVLQETFLFSGSILDNIKYSVKNASYEDVIKAAKIANAHDFIVKFPDGYNTRVGEKGVNLSGGEKQRIAIARAILSNPKILVLDEATSSLDSETEFLIQEALARLTKNRTTFAIAHRLSTLRKSDRIIVIDNNKIAEIGSHKELIEKKGIYYNLVKAQLEMNQI